MPECPRCGRLVEPQAVVSLSYVCPHECCTDCIKALIDNKVYHGAGFEIECPFTPCNGRISHAVICRYSTPKQMLFLQTNMLLYSITDPAKEQVVWCRSCDIPVVAPASCSTVKCSMCKGKPDAQPLRSVRPRESIQTSDGNRSFHAPRTGTEAKSDTSNAQECSSLSGSQASVSQSGSSRSPLEKSSSSSSRFNSCLTSVLAAEEPPGILKLKPRPGQAACPICQRNCFELLPVSQGCDHEICERCLRTLIGSKLFSGGSAGILCPFLGCHQEIPMDTIFKHSTHKQQSFLHVNLVRKSAVENKECIFWCPNCRIPLLGADMANCPKVPCPICKGRFCLYCEKRWRERKSHSQCSQKLEAHTAEAGVKACPGCSTAVAKEEGCNELQCTSCLTRFCWVCNKEIFGKLHFTGSCRYTDDTTRAKLAHPVLWGALILGPVAAPILGVIIAGHCFFLFLKAVAVFYFGDGGCADPEGGSNLCLKFGRVYLACVSMLILAPIALVASALASVVFSLLVLSLAYCVLPVLICCDLSALDRQQLKTRTRTGYEVSGILDKLLDYL